MVERSVFLLSSPLCSGRLKLSEERAGDSEGWSMVCTMKFLSLNLVISKYTVNCAHAHDRNLNFQNLPALSISSPLLFAVLTAVMTELDPKFEFDAPFFVDFEDIRTGMEEEGDVDQWFSSEKDLSNNQLKNESPFLCSELAFREG